MLKRLKRFKKTGRRKPPLGKAPAQPQRSSDEEMNALFPPLSKDVGLDGGFKYRMTFLFAAVSYYVVKLVFFPALTAGNFDLGASAHDLQRYVLYRAAFVVLATVVYLFSYLRDWQFEKVSLAFLMLALTALVVDYFNVYVYLSAAPAQWVPGLIAGRFVAVFCLLMNAMNARHAPPMPRRLWS